jgi:serpin B
MTLVLPDDLAAFEKALSVSQLERITTALASQRKAFGSPGFVESYPYDLHLYLPRFSIETRADLPPVLAALGMPLAFDMDRADFTGIHVPENETDRLYVKKVIHQANIDVDEKGTEAAAATAVVMATGGGPSPLKEITLRLDHPFLFFVRDLETGAVLFMGQVTDPSVGKGS